MCPKQPLIADGKADSCPVELIEDLILLIALQGEPEEDFAYTHAADADAYLQGQQSLGSGHELFLSGDLLLWCHRG